METLRISIFVVRVVGVLLLSGLYLGMHAMYRRGIRRYERRSTIPTPNAFSSERSLQSQSSRNWCS